MTLHLPRFFILAFSILFWAVSVFASCPAPVVPHLIHPSPLQINVSLTPDFSWSDSSSPSCPVTYQFQVSSDPTFPSNNTLSVANLASTNYSLPQVSQFQTSTPLYWKVQATNSTAPNLSSGYSASASFTTYGNTVAPPIVDEIYPSTTVDSSSGSSTALVLAHGGEEGASAHIFLNDGSNSPPEIAAVVIGATTNGSFEIPLNITALSSSAGRRDYYIMIERSVGAVSLWSAASETFSFYYDPSLALPAPILTGGNNAGKLSWSSVPSATSYKVWRRLGMATCDSTTFSSSAQLANEACFAGNRPYAFVTTVASSQNSWNDPQFTDASSSNYLSSPPAEGVSYFVTAENPTTSSSRSLIASFGDRTAPVHLAGENYYFVPLATGREALIFFCGSSPGWFYEDDNSADMRAQIYYQPQTPNQACPTSFSSYSGLTPVVQNFDSFGASNFSTYNEFNCILLAPSSTGVTLANLQPNTGYCYTICLEDATGNQESSCTTPTSGNTPPDTQAPAFGGLTSIAPDVTGTGVALTWVGASSGGDIIQYSIQSTTKLDSHNVPLFDSSASTTLVDGSLIATTIGSLQTATEYCFQASVLDSEGNKNTPPNRWLCTTTLDNRPQINSLSAGTNLNADAPYLLPVNFQISHRLKGQSNLSVSLASLQFSSDGSHWISVRASDLSGIELNNIPFGLNTATAPTVSLVFNTLPYFAGQLTTQFRLQTRDSLGNLSNWQVSSPQVLYAGMSKIGSFDQQSLSSCSLQPNGKFQPLGFLVPLILLALTLLALTSVRKNK